MWKKYDDNREFKIENNVLVVKPIDKDNIVPLFCSVCSFPMKSSDDFIAFKEFESCHKCKIYLAIRDQDKWKAGWRPDKDSEEFKNYIKFRTETFKPIIRFS